MTGTEMYDAIAHMDEELIEGCIARKKARSSERRALAAKKACLGEEKRPSAFKRAALACAAIVAVIALAIGMVALLHIGGKSPVQIAPVGSDAPAPTETAEPSYTQDPAGDPIFTQAEAEDGAFALTFIRYPEGNYYVSDGKSASIQLLLPKGWSVIRGVPDGDWIYPDSEIAGRSPKALMGRDDRSFTLLDENGAEAGHIFTAAMIWTDEYKQLVDYDHLTDNRRVSCGMDAAFAEFKHASCFSVPIGLGEAAARQVVSEPPRRAFVGEEFVTGLMHEDGTKPSFACPALSAYDETCGIGIVADFKDGLFTEEQLESIAKSVRIILVGGNGSAADPYPYDKYNRHDYDALAAFLETESDGKKNGRRLNPGYDPAYPNTWTYKRWNDSFNIAKWDEEGYLIEINALVESYGLVGTLDLSGCERLDKVTFSSESIAVLDLTGCPLMKGVVLQNCSGVELLPDPIVTPRLSASPCFSHLHWVAVPDEEMNKNMYDFELTLDAEGEGQVGVWTSDNLDCLDVTIDEMPAEGCHLAGWYDAEGNLLSDTEPFGLSWFFVPEGEEKPIEGSYSFTAKFEDGLLPFVTGSSYDAYTDAAARLLSGGVPDDSAWDIKSCDVYFHLDDDAFRAYRVMTDYPPETSGGSGARVYSEPLFEYPREVGEEALDWLCNEAPKKAGLDLDSVGRLEGAEGFAGEDWFVLKTVDDSIQDIQFSAVYRTDGKSWYRYGDNNAQLFLPLFGACIVDENVGFLSYYSKFLDEPDETYRKIYLFRTDDGGKTWRDTGLVLPEEYGTVYPGSCLSPVFDGDHGAMLVSAVRTDLSQYTPSDELLQKLWYETYDGGKTWTLHDEKKRGAAGSGVASWPVDTDGDGIDELFCVDAGLMQRDAFSRAWLEDGSGRVLGNPIYCGSASVAQGTFAVVESPEYGVCIMRLMPEFEGEEFGYMLYKCVSGSLECVYWETLWSYSGEEGDEPPSRSEAKDYERRVNELLSSGRVLFSCDSWGAMHRDFYNIKTNKSLKNVIDGKTFFISTYNSAGRTGELEDVLDGETALVLDVPVGYRFVYEPFYGGPAE
ncbi:MAG: hypothetical protein II897_06660 [Clostridia bacterium]|nr:hypothetical protein [Clostridia bacterium]